MQKISTIRTSGNTIVEGDKLTIGSKNISRLSGVASEAQPPRFVLLVVPNLVPNWSARFGFEFAASPEVISADRNRPSMLGNAPWHYIVIPLDASPNPAMVPVLLFNAIPPPKNSSPPPVAFSW